MKKGVKKLLLAVISILVALAAASCSAPTKASVGSSPTAILIWHYYNGVQKQLFDQLVSQFNETVGEEKNIVVEAVNQGSINELAQKTLDALNHKVGAQEAPDVFAAYSDTVYLAAMQNMVANIGAYFTDEEKAEYLESYIKEGDLNNNGSLYIFPIAKATEVLILNLTDWQRFVKATGALESDLATWEGIVRLAEAYYRWTDSLTEAPEDGKAFFGRDAMANYMLVGCAQLGKELFTAEGGTVALHTDMTIMRRLWNQYYIPYINGYFASFGRFRSDDVKTGDLIAFVGSTSSAAFFPAEVTLADGNTYPIEARVYPAPNFEGSKPFAVQQGAGMAVSKSNPQKEEAAITFLKWFTNRNQNEIFCGASGYLPVKKAASEDLVPESTGAAGKSPVVRSVLEVGQAMAQTYTLYSGKPFLNGNAARAILESNLQEKAAKDRALVLARMAEGLTRKEAAAEFDTPENFYQWYSSLVRQLELAAGLRPKKTNPRFMVE
jgi:multiple sugar transport system substrate-binding protein